MPDTWCSGYDAFRNCRSSLSLTRARRREADPPPDPASLARPLPRAPAPGIAQRPRHRDHLSCSARSRTAGVRWPPSIRRSCRKSGRIRAAPCPSQIAESQLELDVRFSGLGPPLHPFLGGEADVERVVVGAELRD